MKRHVIPASFIALAVVVALIAIDRTDSAAAIEHAPHSTRAVAQTAGGEMRIRLTFDGKVAVVKLRDNPTARDLLGLLPLTVTLSDYAATEKIANLPRKLSTTGAPSGFDPSIGDVTYYAPWGNLAIFYKDFGYAKGLIALGAVESGLTELSTLGQTVSVKIERIK